MFLLGVNLPDNKIVSVALRSIYGIGKSTSESICNQLLIHRHCKLRELPEEKVTQLSQLLNGMKIETELRREVIDNIQNLVQIGSYRGLRHKAGLPVHGARTRTNAKTAKRLNGKMLGQARSYSTGTAGFIDSAKPSIFQFFSS
ncbi:hypothetical protein HDU67_000504 [Dinochytrium kinnereticum]|nr:hypothetical protein HDU67_000504 [Dinochytrium kinnereticum]